MLPLQCALACDGRSWNSAGHRGTCLYCTHSCTCLAAEWIPTRVLHPFAVDEPAATMPHLQALLARATSMRLKWQEDAVEFAASSAQSDSEAAASSFAPSDRALATTLRFLGLDPSECAAASLRAKLLHQQRASSGVSASPAAAYPPAFGRAKVELATQSPRRMGKGSQGEGNQEAAGVDSNKQIWCR